MSIKLEDLSEAEVEALRLMRTGFNTMVNRIPDKTYRDGVGIVTPGMAVYRRLAKKGLCYQTEEEPLEDGFVFTESMELTDAGLELAQKL